MSRHSQSPVEKWHRAGQIGPARPRSRGGCLGRALGRPGSSLTPGWGWILGKLLGNPQVLPWFARSFSPGPGSPLTAEGRPALPGVPVHPLLVLALRPASCCVFQKYVVTTLVRQAPSFSQIQELKPRHGAPRGDLNPGAWLPNTTIDVHRRRRLTGYWVLGSNLGVTSEKEVRV